MRRDRLKINQSTGLREIRQDLRNMLKEHRTLALHELQNTAEDMYVESIAKVPVETGRLMDSIEITVSKSPRYPGIVATATARNPRTDYDYAFLQEVNTDYRHPNGGQAHFLEEPFRKEVQKFFERMGWQ